MQARNYSVDDAMDITALQCATQPVGILQFLISPWFIMILIYFVCTIPFIGLGIIDVFRRLDNWTKQRKGWIQVRKKLSNLHWLTFWTRPTGRKVNIKTEEGVEIELPIEIQEGMLGMQKDLDNAHFKSEKKSKQNKDEKYIETNKLSKAEVMQLNYLLSKVNA